VAELERSVTGGAFFVDDDLISAQLERAGVKRRVLPRSSPAAQTLAELEARPLHLSAFLPSASPCALIHTPLVSRGL